MFARLKNSLTFKLEQLIMRGPVAHFGLILVVILLVALAAGLLIRQLVPGFDSIGDAVWWAFEHLVVPEYVDGDEGVIKRTVATTLIVFGSILFAGAVIAILVQWMDEAMERLKTGLTPVALDAHIVLLGWTSRTPTILQEIMVSQERVERFLRRRGVRRLHVALLAEGGDASLMQEIRLKLGEHWNARQIILRSGSPLSLDDLTRVDFAHAGVIVIPAADTTGLSAMDADTRTVKTLMTLGAALQADPPEEPPLMVVELQDPRHTATLRTLYEGPMEIIAGDEIIAGLMVQTVRHPGLSHVYAELLTDVGESQIYVREEPQLAGVSVQQLTYALPMGVLLGLVRPVKNGFKALLNPPDDLKLEAGDRIAVLDSSYRDTALPETIDAAVQLAEKPVPEPRTSAKRRVLILGWNHRVPLILNELASHPAESFTIDVVSQVSAAKRQKRLAAEGPAPEQLQIRQLEFDYTVPAYLDDIDLASYDNVVLLASERLKAGAESDARTILGYLLLLELMASGEKTPPVLVELTDPDNATLFDNRRAEIIVSPVIVSHMLTRVTLRRELRAVLDELFGSGSSDIFFRRVTDFNLNSGEHTFVELQQAADARGEIAIGIRWAGQQNTSHGGIELNIARDTRLEINDGDELIILSTED